MWHWLMQGPSWATKKGRRSGKSKPILGDADVVRGAGAGGVAGDLSELARVDKSGVDIYINTLVLPCISIAKCNYL